RPTPASTRPWARTRARSAEPSHRRRPGLRQSSPSPPPNGVSATYAPTPTRTAPGTVGTAMCATTTARPTSGAAPAYRDRPSVPRAEAERGDPGPEDGEHRRAERAQAQRRPPRRREGRRPGRDHDRDGRPPLVQARPADGEQQRGQVPGHRDDAGPRAE